jgi:hypothetical protein
MYVARNWILPALACGAGVSLWTSSLLSDSDTPAPQQLVAARVEKGPELKAELSDAWEGAQLTRVLTRGGHIGDTWVDLRAMHDGEYLYVHASWADETRSVSKQPWVFEDGTWTKGVGDEDRIAFFFNINTPRMNTEGCDALCHTDYIHAPEPGQTADTWHWKAGRGGLFGHSDDQYVRHAQGASGRADDAGRSNYANNQNAERTGPARRWLEDADRQGAFREDTSAAIEEGWQPPEGYSVPSILVREPEGSRGDVRAAGRWHEGRWSVMFKRKLNTGNPDDAQFEPGKRVAFGVALFDNTGAKVGNEHSKSGVVHLTIAEPAD